MPPSVVPKIRQKPPYRTDWGVVLILGVCTVPVLAWVAAIVWLALKVTPG